MEKFVMGQQEDEGEPMWAKKLMQEFKEVRREINELNDHVAEKIKMIDQKVDTTKKQLEDKIEELEFNSRKYNLLVWGLGPVTSENCEQKVKQFIHNELKIESELQLAACHPVKGDTCIVRFVRLSDRDAVLRSGAKLKGKAYSIKTGLPPRLRQLRATLRAEAKTLKNDGRIVRVVERGKGVYMQEKLNGSWKTLTL